MGNTIKQSNSPFIKNSLFSSATPDLPPLPQPAQLNLPTAIHSLTAVTHRPVFVISALCTNWPYLKCFPVISPPGVGCVIKITKFNQFYLVHFLYQLRGDLDFTHYSIKLYYPLKEKINKTSKLRIFAQKLYS